jgi:hypothetical protein
LISDDDTAVADILKLFYSLERSAFESIKPLFFGDGSLGDIAAKFLEASKKLTGHVDPVQLITDLSYATEQETKVAIASIAALSTFRRIITR